MKISDLRNNEIGVLINSKNNFWDGRCVFRYNDRFYLVGTQRNEDITETEVWMNSEIRLVMSYQISPDSAIRLY